MKTLLVSPDGRGNRLALLTASGIHDFDYDCDNAQGLLDSLYYGSVLRSFPHFALVDIGLSRPGFLSFTKEKCVEGQSLFVQISREAMADVGEGQKLEKGVQLKLWQGDLQIPTTPGLVQRGPTAFERILKTELQLHIWVETWAIKAALQPLLGPEQTIDVQTQLFKAYDLEDLWDDLFKTIVPLPSQGNLVFEYTSSLNIIDINAAGDHPRATNLRAIPYILQQLRWRHLGGNFLIDFIDSRNSAMRQLILKSLKQHLAERGEALHILGWSALGPLQIRRPLKTRPLWMKVSA